MSKRKPEREPPIVTGEPPNEIPATTEDSTIFVLEAKPYEVDIKMTQAEFDQALYGLGFDGAEAYEMWAAFNQHASVTIRLKKA